MPIGKNAIKRVTNNGYSSTKTSAPDMENSVVIEEPKAAEEKKAAVVEKSLSPKAKKTVSKKTPTKAAPVKKNVPKAEKKSPSKKTAPKKSMETEPELSPISTLEKVTQGKKREGNGYINLGGELPYYLL